MSLHFENTTQDTVAVIVYPNTGYGSVFSDMYKFSDGAGYRERTFSILPNERTPLFTSSNPDQTPYALSAKVFRSIEVYIKGNTIRFSPEAVLGYTENPFAATSTWEYRLDRYDLPTMFKRNPVEDRTYRFVLTENKLQE